MQIGNAIVGDAEGNDFGRSLLLSTDETVLAVGAIYNDGVDGSNSRQVCVFCVDSMNTD